MSALTDGLRFYWDAASPTTSTGPDSNAVTLFNTPGSTSTTYGTGLTLDGSNQSVSMGRKFTYANGTMFVVVGSAATIGGTPCLATQSSDDAGNAVGLGVQSGVFNVNGVGATYGALTGDLWLAMTWGAAGIRIFSAGSLIDTNGSTGAPTGPAGAYYFSLGCFHYSGGRIFHHASNPVMFAVFDAALSDGAIGALYNSTGSTLRAYLAGGGQIASRNGIALSTISAINGITKSGISAINGLTI